MAIRDKIGNGNVNTGNNTGNTASSGQAQTSDKRSEERARREAECANWPKEELIKRYVDKLEFAEVLQRDNNDLAAELEEERERASKNEKGFVGIKKKLEDEKASKQADIEKAVKNATTKLKGQLGDLGAERDAEVAKLKAERDAEIEKQVKKAGSKAQKEIERLNAKISELEQANLEGVAVKQMLGKMKDGISDKTSELNSALVTLLSEYSEKLLGACTEVVKEAQDEITRKQREREVRLEAKKKLESKIALQAELKAEIAELEGLVVDEA